MSQPITSDSVLQPFQECLASLTGLALQRAKRADVILGMPRHNCRFHGICRVEKHGTSRANKPHNCAGETVTGWLLRPEPNHCILLIKKGGLAPDRERYHFDRRQIEVSQPVKVSSFYAKEGGKKFFLKEGYYPLRNTRDYYALHLPLISQSLLTNHANPNRHE